jgi:hypothetical protein
MIKDRPFAVAKILITTAAVISVLYFLIPIFIGRPTYEEFSRYERSIVRHGLPDIWDILLTFLNGMTIICVSVSYYFSYSLLKKLKWPPSAEDNLSPIRMTLKICKYSAFTMMLLSAMQTVAAIYGLSTVQTLDVRYFFDSKLIAISCCLLLGYSFFLIYKQFVLYLDRWNNPQV